MVFLKFALSLVAVVVFLIGTIYVFLAYPIIAIVRCSSDKTLSPRAKSLWLLSILILGPITAAAFSITRPGTPSHRGRGIGILVFSLLWFVFLGGGFMYARSDAIKHARLAAEYVSFIEVDDAARGKFRASVHTLANEIDSMAWHRFDDQIHLIGLSTQLKSMTDDGTMDRLEVEEWLTAFENRHQR
jgi:hypothetical protein